MASINSKTSGSQVTPDLTMQADISGAFKSIISFVDGVASSLSDANIALAKLSKAAKDLAGAQTQSNNAMTALQSRKNVKDVLNNGSIDQIGKLVETAIQKRTQNINTKEKLDLQALEKKFSKGKITEAEYTSQKKNISDRAQKEREDETAGGLADFIVSKMEGKSPEEQKKAKKELKGKIKDVAGEGDRLDEEVEKEEQTADKKLKIREEYIKKSAELGKELLGITFDALNREIEAELESLEEKREANEEWAEEEKARIDDMEMTGVLSKDQADAQKQLIDDKAKLREDELEKRKKELLRRQAKNKKAQALADAAINVATAITAAWTNPLTAPALSIIISAIGAAQIAAIAATPIPEYAMGTAGHPGGLAIVGDGGRSELIYADGKFYKTPATDTLVDLPQHAMVMPDYEKAIEAMAFAGLSDQMGLNTDRTIRLSELSGLFRSTNRQIGAFMNAFNKDSRNRRYDSLMGRVSASKRDKSWRMS